jgi:hypothetical protein
MTWWTSGRMSPLGRPPSIPSAAQSAYSVNRYMTPHFCGVVAG